MNGDEVPSHKKKPSAIMQSTRTKFRSLNLLLANSSISKKYILQDLEFTSCKHFDVIKLFTLCTDLIAIPDFGAGAMENWGLITYRETSILYDAEETSASGNQWVAIVVAHELAHQVRGVYFPS